MRAIDIPMDLRQSFIRETGKQMKDANLKAAMVQGALVRPQDLPGLLGMTPQKGFSSVAVGTQTQPLNATNELALARHMGLSPERYLAVTGRPYPVA